jgi:tetratricopeptide (TPR) repeat protein
LPSGINGFFKETKMKFKPLYFYGFIVVIAAVLLIMFTQQNNPDETTETIVQDQNMPDDDVHSKFKTGPGKENVSEEFHIKLAELKKTVEQNPNDTLAMRNYADYLTAAHKMDEAITYYEKILKVDPSRSDIHFNLSLIYYNKRDLVKAAEENQKVLKYDPDNQMALYNAGAISATNGDKKKAEEYWKKVIKIDPESRTGKLAKESLGKL